MSIINDPNKTTLEGLIRKVDTVDPQHPGYMEEHKPTSGFFPTGEFLGMPVSKGMQDLIGQIVLLGIGGGTGAQSTQALLKKLMSKIKGVKSSKNIVEAGRLDLLHDAYTGGKFIPGVTSKTVRPGGKTVSRGAKPPAISSGDITKEKLWTMQEEVKRLGREHQLRVATDELSGYGLDETETFIRAFRRVMPKEMSNRYLKNIKGDNPLKWKFIIR